MINSSNNLDIVDSGRYAPTLEDKKYLKGPIVTADWSWADSVPAVVAQSIPKGRFEVVVSGSKYVSYPEYIHYLMTASLAAPLSGEYMKLYAAVSCEFFKEIDPGKYENLKEVWASYSITGIDSLSRYELGLLNELGLKIRSKIVKHRKY
jgi:hypothetical protein